MIDGNHPEGFGLFHHVASDAAQAEDAENLATWIVSDGRWWIAFKEAAAEGEYCCLKGDGVSKVKVGGLEV